jgi:cytochrome c biogenesis protein CcmG, thiol:disulfide interchange protein DsbE
MKLRIAAVTLILTALSSAAIPQAKAPSDPQLIDAPGFQKIVAKYHGKPLLINFWATWCEPCRDEYPLLNELAKQYQPQGLAVVGVNYDQDGDLILMRRFIARYKPVFTNYRKKQGGEAEFNQIIPGWKGELPATVFYDRDGKQVGHILGAGTRETFEPAIRSLLSSRASSNLQPQPATPTAE